MLLLHHLPLLLLTLPLPTTALTTRTTTKTPTTNTTTSVTLKWLTQQPPSHHKGTTFGLPWPRARHFPNTSRFALDASTAPFQSWITALWGDGSIKWSAHALGAEGEGGEGGVKAGYRVVAGGGGGNGHGNGIGNATGGGKGMVVVVEDREDEIEVKTGALSARFAKGGDVLVREVRGGKGVVVGVGGRLVLRSQSAVGEGGGGDGEGVEYFEFKSRVYNATVSSEGEGAARALVTVRGVHSMGGGEMGGGRGRRREDWLPFTVRFYLYAGSDAIRVVHTVVYDGDARSDFIAGIGIRFDVPLAGEALYDRHVRFAGVEGGILHEAVQGVTGLRRDPGAAVRSAQYNGTKTPDKSTWDTKVSGRLQWIPAWNDFRLTQLSPDGFNIKKRTKAGQSWVKIPGGTRAGGLAYLGGATKGGLAVGLRDFWKKYPTGLDVSDAATDQGSITLWLYSPSAEPMDLRPYRDGLGEDTYAKQLDALEVTYEDWEEGYNTPYGIARTNEIFIYAFDSTPSADRLSQLTNQTNEPPVLFAEPSYIQETRALGSYWKTLSATSGTAEAAEIESHLDFLIKFYNDQIEQRRWYGFWDHGDIMHGYDTDRHQWRYDIGGYAWDNSELSPDLFFWNHFLRTGRADIYRLAEAQARHGGEVDSYHLGNFTGLGSRHNVQHWGDSAKQARVSTPVYRKTFYYISGGDERTGDLIHEALQAERGFYLVDARRKVRAPNITYTPDPKALYLDFGTDWAGVAAAYLLEWERRGPRWEESRSKLLETARTYPLLKNGFVTGEALYNSLTGSWSPPPTDPSNNGTVSISHLSAVFGVLETLDQLFEHDPSSIPQPFIDAWLDYCYFYSAPNREQIARYGKSFGSVNLRQGHARLTAYAANRRNNASLARRAWDEFLNDNSPDELSPGDPWKTVWWNGSSVLTPVEEADWITTNAAALYGLAGIELLALVGSRGGGNGTNETNETNKADETDGSTQTLAGRR